MNEPIDLIYLTGDLDLERQCMCPSCGSENFQVLNELHPSSDDTYDVRRCDDCDQISLIDYANVYDADLQKPVLVRSLMREKA